MNKEPRFTPRTLESDRTELWLTLLLLVSETLVLGVLSDSSGALQASESSQSESERSKRFLPSLEKMSRCVPGSQAATRLNKMEMVYRWVIVVFIFLVL